MFYCNIHNHQSRGFIVCYMNLLEHSFRFTENSHTKAKHRIPHLFSLVRKMYLHLEKRTSIQNNALLSDWSTHFEVEYDWIELTQQLIKSVQHSE